MKGKWQNADLSIEDRKGGVFVIPPSRSWHLNQKEKAGTRHNLRATKAERLPICNGTCEVRDGIKPSFRKYPSSLFLLFLCLRVEKH